MNRDDILQEIHEEFVNSEEYQKFLWEIDNTQPSLGENS